MRWGSRLGAVQRRRCAHPRDRPVRLVDPHRHAPPIDPARSVPDSAPSQRRGGRTTKERRGTRVDSRRFDALTRSLAAPTTRRGLLGSLAALVAGVRAASAQSDCPPGQTRNRKGDCNCPAGTDVCPDTCFNLKKDLANSGRCGRSCAGDSQHASPAPGPWISTCQRHLTATTPADTIAHVHDRMPVILRPEDEARWIDRAERDPRRLLPLLRPDDADRLTFHPVGLGVGTITNDGPELVAPVRSPASIAAPTQLALLAWRAPAFATLSILSSSPTSVVTPAGRRSACCPGRCCVL